VSLILKRLFYTIRIDVKLLLSLLDLQNAMGARALDPRNVGLSQIIVT